MNEGIAGNRFLHGDVGPNALSRFDCDVLPAPDVRFVTDLLGINDIGLGGSIPTEAVSADDIIGGYRQPIARAHSHSILIYGATLTPFDNFGSPYFSAVNEAERQLVNAWIRASGEFDAVIDFDSAIQTIPRNYWRHSTAATTRTRTTPATGRWQTPSIGNCSSLATISPPVVISWVAPSS